MSLIRSLRKSKNLLNELIGRKYSYTKLQYDLACRFYYIFFIKVFRSNH